MKDHAILLAAVGLVLLAICILAWIGMKQDSPVMLGLAGAVGTFAGGMAGISRGDKSSSPPQISNSPNSTVVNEKES
jgi:hypothetical protein